jgi:glycosyltransferase involved in cell wall biosynthesis
MRLHLVGLPHTETTAEFCACAYTSKIVKGAKMFMDAGHEVFIYGGEANDAPCTEHVCVVGRGEQGKWFGKRESHEQFPNIWDPRAEWWKTMNGRAAHEITKRVQPRDLVLTLAGVCQQELGTWLHPRDAEVIEWGVGYYGTFARCCAYESYSHMATLYGQKGIEDGRPFDAVIHNFFDPSEFPLQNDGSGEYLLYVGRLVTRKGLNVCAKVSEVTGIPLVIAGQGAKKWGKGWVESDELTVRGDLEYVGAVGIEERNELMAGAMAVLVPTLYIEPFGGVAVEAQMCGTPALASDWGAFPETVEEEWRCRVLSDFVDAVDRAPLADHEFIRARAHALFGLEPIGERYEGWFDRIQTLWGDGWYELSGVRFSDTASTLSVVEADV